MMDPIQIHRAFDQIKVSLLRLKSELLPSNINWFVEFFTELLLQIGLIPMQELDDDILKNVADKQRLQVRIVCFQSFALQWYADRVG